MLWFGNKTQIDFTAVTNCKLTEGCEGVHGHSMRNQFLCHKNIISMGMTGSKSKEEIVEEQPGTVGGFSAQ